MKRPHPNRRDPSSLPAELRRTNVPPTVREWIRRETGAAVIKVRRLPGASTSAVHVVVLSDGRHLVLRRYVWRWVLQDEPMAPQREVDALNFASAAGLFCPRPIAVDVPGLSTGDGIPAILTTKLAGTAVAVPDLYRLAETAGAIHSLSAETLGHRYFPWYRGTTTAAPESATRPQLWETAIEIWRSEMPSYRPTLVHRDFHPGNVLWVRGRCSGVVDWVNACEGPPGCDVAHCRWNLIELAGPQSADQFLDAYQDITGNTYHPYWEIASVLEHGPSSWDSGHIAQAETLLTAALDLLGKLPRGRP
ncbi:MAG TPA: aminoglycoside phosphotransferase family protein [Acidimicrobiales bacterium]|nr:aminoglycoside phosphotransferase family protein [Acidimicrobiales bacterium]